ncbi:serine hydrolase domain-containing protein [Ferrimonas gelatinilytica]|uniref:Beta-lactamase-related domain-containing protein n=1 Tax=Ferrimonas gelatinilytica TaxID=1255257 RepID=A0ABP9SGS0_9GAMM
MTRSLMTSLCLATALVTPGQVLAAERTPLEEFVEGFPIELAERTIAASLPVWMAGGDESHYWSMRTSEVLPTAIVPRRIPTMALGERLMPQIGAIKAETENFGSLTLNEFLARSDSFSQAFMVIHKGNIVFESYPRMRPSDHHVWMSNAKPTASLLIEILISQGLIDENAPMSDYIKEFKGTAWEGVTVIHTLNMASGLDIDDTAATRADPNSHPHRLYLAEFNRPYKGKVERMIDVLADAKYGSKPGQKFVYASAHTQALVLLAEAVTGERWAQSFDRLVWSKIGSEGPLQVHTSPDGVALAHGVISSRLADMARFGMLYTPSWNKIATEQVVTDEILARIQDGVQSHEFLMAGDNGPTYSFIMGDGDAPTFVSSSRQWDLLWEDGDMWKGGMMSQGLYVSPDKDLVIVYVSTNNDDHSIHRWMRPIATSGLFE